MQIAAFQGFPLLALAGRRLVAGAIRREPIVAVRHRHRHREGRGPLFIQLRDGSLEALFFRLVGGRNNPGDFAVRNAHGADHLVRQQHLPGCPLFLRSGNRILHVLRKFPVFRGQQLVAIGFIDRADIRPQIGDFRIDFRVLFQISGRGLLRRQRLIHFHGAP